MNTKFRFGVLTLLIAALLLPVVPVMGQGAQTLTITWWGGQTRHDRTIAVIEMYEEATGVNIEYEFSGWGDYWTRVTTQAAGGELACIMQQDYRYVTEWQSRGLLRSLEPYIESGVIDTTDIPESILASGRVGEELYAFNLGVNSQAWVLDLDAFEAAGVELPAWDWTWEDFENITLQLHEALGIWGFGGSLSQIPLWPSIYLGHGEFTYNENGTAVGYEDDQPLIDHYNMILRLMDAGAVLTQEEQAEYQDSSVETGTLTTGKAAMEYMWSNGVVGLVDAAGEDRHFGLWPVPRPVGGQSSNFIKPSQFFSITSQCDDAEAEEAAKFISFFVNDLAANEILFAERGVPAPSTVREHLGAMLEPAQALVFDFIAKVSEDASPINPPDPPGAGDISSNVWTPLFEEPVLYGQISVEEGVQIFRDEANLILSENE